MRKALPKILEASNYTSISPDYLCITCRQKAFTTEDTEEIGGDSKSKTFELQQDKSVLI